METARVHEFQPIADTRKVAQRLLSEQATHHIPLPPDLPSQFERALSFGTSPNVERLATTGMGNVVYLLTDEQASPHILKIHTDERAETKFINELGGLTALGQIFQDSPHILIPKIEHFNSHPDEPPFLLLQHIAGRSPQVLHSTNPNLLTQDMELILNYLGTLRQTNNFDYAFFAHNYKDSYHHYATTYLGYIRAAYQHFQSTDQLPINWQKLAGHLSAVIKNTQGLLISGGEIRLQKGDEHSSNFLITPNNQLVVFDAEAAGYTGANMPAAEFVWHENTRIPIEARTAAAQHFATIAQLNPFQRQAFNLDLQMAWVKWLAIELRMSQPGSIQHHPLGSLIPVDHSFIRNQIAEEVNYRIDLGPHAVQI